MAGKRPRIALASSGSGKVAQSQAAFIDDVRAILRQARRKAYAASNFIMVEAYWNIGRRIVMEEQGGKDRAEYGSFLVRNLARQLGEEFGSGVSVANLWNFRQFYLTFPTEEKLYSLRRELTWTHWRLLMRVEDSAARDYYIREAAEQGWNTRQLERNIATHSYKRLLAAPTAKSIAKAHPAPSPVDFIKDPYVLEFLGLPEPLPDDERGLETAIVLRLRDFIMELGKGFSFVGRQPMTTPLSASSFAPTRTTPSSAIPCSARADSSSPRNTASSSPAKRNCATNLSAATSCNCRRKARGMSSHGDGAKLEKAIKANLKGLGYGG